MLNVSKVIPHYTIKDYSIWEGDWELIEGIPYAMAPSPTFKHQLVSSNINWVLKEALKNCQHCLALFEIDWIISEDTVVRPDNIVICYQPEGDYITRTPEIIFEVVSKTTAQKDEYLKFILYEREGVNYYILVYPELKRAEIFKLKEGKFIKMLDAVNETVEFKVKDGKLHFDFSKIWA